MTDTLRRVLPDRVVVSMNGIVIEVLLPSFALGACIAEPNWSASQQATEDKARRPLTPPGWGVKPRTLKPNIRILHTNT